MLLFVKMHLSAKIGTILQRKGATYPDQQTTRNDYNYFGVRAPHNHHGCLGNPDQIVLLSLPRVRTSMEIDGLRA